VHDKTQSHTSILTQGYAPLEQYSSNSRKGSYSDIYSLGAVFYFALTGQKPMDAATRTQETMPAPKELVPDIPDEANLTIMKAMQLKAENRYQKVDEFMRYLLNEDTEIFDKQPVMTYTPKKKLKPRYTLGGIMLVIIIGCVIIYKALPIYYEKQGDHFVDEHYYGKAAEMYRKGIVRNNECLFKLYQLIRDEKIEPNSQLIEQLFSLLSLLAEQGDAKGQQKLGNMYYYGDGVDKDYVEAVKWYRKSAEQGDAHGQGGLADMYYHGYGVDKDYVEAIKWYRKSAEQGDAMSQFDLGIMYENGYGVDKDYVEAVKWYRKSAEQGNAGAQINLGFMYSKGYGVDEDYVEAVKWYRKSAEQGNANAQNNLGFMYENGYGVVRDYYEAVKWYRKSAEQGDADAQNGLGGMYYNGEGVVRDYYEAVKWYRKSAEQGDAKAQHNLGMMYENGYGVVRDYYEAVKWYRKSAEQGNAGAQIKLKRLGINGYGW
jgi:TPR repeat protein